MSCRVFLSLGALAVAAALLGGCDRTTPAAPAGATTTSQPATAARRALPRYGFAAGLEKKYPGPCAFLVGFLETCLANDYEGYRTMVSRRFEPETRERFEAIYKAIQTVHVDSIEPVSLPALSDEVYRVISDIKLDPTQAVSVRGPNRKIAILVLREQGKWRMVTAPPQLQPKPTPAPTPASAPAPTSQPSYPWDQSGDD